ncbi:MAG: site-2 protease family protein [Sedimentisphaerales bacterium]|nr:site-2 protease family protein [Sedimentisphaerales bacterium]
MSYVIVFVLISFLILIHELGHFIAAKLSNIPIERFSIGFGPKLWAFGKGQTEYRLSALPIGGYVLPRIEDEDDFFLIPARKRIVFALGGPFANVLFALICLSFLNAMTMGFSLYGILAYPFVQTIQISSQVLTALPQMFSQPEYMSGIIGIVAVGGRALSGDLTKIFGLAAMLNINLALLNLLPVLPLDGGKILFCLLEKIHRSLARLHLPLMVTGWVLLLGLILSITVMDVCKLVKGISRCIL